MNMEGFPTPQPPEAAPKFEDRLKAVFARVYAAIDEMSVEQTDADARKNIEAFESTLAGALSDEAKETLAALSDAELYQATTDIFQYVAEHQTSMEAGSISKEDIERDILSKKAAA
jgi:hypothetical protein